MDALGRMSSTSEDCGDVQVKHFIRLLMKLIHEKRIYLFYSYNEQKGTGNADRSVRVYDSWKEIPAQFRKISVPSRFMNVMYYRLQRGDARLLCYTEDGNRLQAYGWIQSWRPFRRKFSMLAPDGIMLGPYWTAPENRGRRLYGRLLQHSLHICSREKLILIYTSPDNIASQKGIARAGFQARGKWMVSSWLCVFKNQHRLPELPE